MEVKKANSRVSALSQRPVQGAPQRSPFTWGLRRKKLEKGMLKLCLRGKEVFVPSAGSILPPCVVAVGGAHNQENAVAQCGQSLVSGRPAESGEQELDHTVPVTCGELLKGLEQRIAWSHL